MFTEEYFSKWFDIISEHDARTLWNDRERSFPDALFGLDKVK